MCLSLFLFEEVIARRRPKGDRGRARAGGAKRAKNGRQAHFCVSCAGKLNNGGTRRRRTPISTNAPKGQDSGAPVHKFWRKLAEGLGRGVRPTAATSRPRNIILGGLSFAISTGSGPRQRQQHPRGPQGLGSLRERGRTRTRPPPARGSPDAGATNTKFTFFDLKWASLRTYLITFQADFPANEGSQRFTYAIRT